MTSPCAANDNRAAPSGKLAENIMHFARVLREAGVPAGPGSVLDALEAARFGAIGSREDFYWMLHAIFVKRAEHKPLYDQAFHVFWRRPKMLEQLMQMFLQQVQVQTAPKKKDPGLKRLAAAMFDQRHDQPARDQPPGQIDLDAEMTASAREVLQDKDFEQMSVEEQRQAKDAIAKMHIARVELATRRFKPAAQPGRIDMRRTLQKSLRDGAGAIDMAWRQPRKRQPPLVILCDISGSVENYSRIFLHFLHALTNSRDRVQVFLFGTRLTNVTRELRRRDVDEAVDKVAGAVQDWSGGTRIGEALLQFNFQWSRRVMAGGAHVLIMTDGLERDDVDLLEAEMARLGRTARRLIWLNPLLRYDLFEPRAQGIKAMLRYVDEFRPVHSLNSLRDIAHALSAPAQDKRALQRWTI